MNRRSVAVAALSVAALAIASCGYSGDPARTASAAVQAQSESKVQICHRPPGNPANDQIIAVGGNAAAAHLANHPDDAEVCRVCVNGKACGDSCINPDLNCQQPPGCACNANEGGSGDPGGGDES